MKYRDLSTGAPPAPAAIVVLKPAAWSATYAKRPGGDVALGLRLLTEAELMTAHAEASKEAAGSGRTGEAYAFRFNEALVCWSLAAALCDPNDASKPYLTRADDEVREAFPADTLRHLWHELEAAQVACSPVRPPADDDDVAALAGLLSVDPTLSALPAATAARVRRFLRFCLDELNDTESS